MKNKIIKFINNFSKNFSNFKPPKLLVFLIITISTIFISLSHFRLDNDFWFLINTGKYILNNGFPTIEPFTVHTDMFFVAQQWLTDVIFYLVYDKFDIYGMFVFIVLCDLLIAFLIYKLSMLVSDNKVKISVVTTLIINLFLSASFITTRPQLFDILLLLTEIYLLELYIKRNNKLFLIGLPIISFLMINLHSALWLMIFVFLIPYYVERIIKKESYELKPLIITTVIMLIVGLINPYGIEAIKYLFGSYGIDEINNYIAEMHPITISSHLLVFIIIFIALGSYYYNKNNNKIRYFLLFLGTLYLGLSHHKGLLFFYISVILSYGYNFKNLFEENSVQKTWYKEKSMNIFLLIMLLIFLFQYSYKLCNSNIKEKNQPALNEIANYLDNNIDKNIKKNIKLYTSYDEGGYFEYRGYKCYLDPRAEVFLKANNKKEDIFIEFFYLQSKNSNYEEFLNKYNFDYLVVNEYDILYNNIDTEDYEIVYEKGINYDFNSKKEIKYRIYKKKEL